MARRLERSLSPAVTDEFRPDVEGLRALAVVAVVAFHLRLGAVRGGFVGVDVFFVVSGYLITRLLLKELAATGTLSLRAFWARRARRLLPAATLVIVSTVIVAAGTLSPLALRALAVDAIAAACFVVNFVFAHRLGDYFGAQLGATSPSPLLHFWSLAVEEQFYLLWPLVLVALTRRARQYRRLLMAVIVVGATVSLLLSIWMTASHPTWAFYLLPARAGELLAGAALAAAGPTVRMVPARLRALGGWLGIAGIFVACVRYSEATRFPGTAVLLPVLSTMLVVVAGGPDADRLAPGAVLGVRPLEWIGRHSYGIYLWHWPALVLAEAALGPLPLSSRLLVVGISVCLAVISYHLVEDPVRHNRWLSLDPARGLAVGGALCALSLSVGWVALSRQPPLDGGTLAAAPLLAVSAPGDPPTATTAPAAEARRPVVSSMSLPPLTPLPTGDLTELTNDVQQALSTGLATQDVPSNLRPKLNKVNGDRARIYADGCVAIGTESKLARCEYGAVGSATKVVLFGDSHAAQWFPPLEQLAEADGFELVVLTKGGCPTAEVTIPTATLARTCPTWRDAAVERIAQLHPALVIASSWAGYPNDDDEWSAGFRQIVQRLVPTTAHLVVLGDNPSARTEPASCLSSHVRSVPACTATPEAVVASSRLAAERSVAEAAGARYVDTTSWLCTPSRCPVIVGDILLYRDATHLTTVATTWLRPLLAAALAPSLGRTA